MNLALYREFRPKDFDGVIGQDFIVKTLKNQIKLNKLTFPFLFITSHFYDEYNLQLKNLLFVPASLC